MDESLEYTARIRARSVCINGDDMPDDMHHDYMLHITQGGMVLEYMNDQKCQSVPLTLGDIEAINAACEKYRQMRKVIG